MGKRFKLGAGSRGGEELRGENGPANAREGRGYRVGASVAILGVNIYS